MTHKRLFISLWIVVIASRFAAVSMTLVDWDETLFAFGVHDYDVAHQHPHPPGYPLFILLAKLVRLVAASDFRALQVVATIASMLIFPAMFLLARELQLGETRALIAATIASFIPTVWYFGGTGLSDVPALVLALFASALILRGHPAGYLLAACAAGIRPHLLLLCAGSAILPVPGRRDRRPYAGTIALIALIALFYLGAAFFSSDFPHGYLREFEVNRASLASADSFLNPARPPLGSIAKDAFLFPYGGDRARFVLLALCVAGLFARPRRAVAIVLAMFVPIAIFTWLMLDVSSLARYAVSYMLLYALLAAMGIDLVARRFAPVITALVVGMMIQWAWPALKVVRTTPSPPVDAFHWVRENVPAKGPRVFVENELAMHAEYLLQDRALNVVFDNGQLHDDDFAPGNVFVIEGLSSQPGAKMFVRPRKRLWQLARPRYFEVAVIPMHTMVRYGDGWYGEERVGAIFWNWMRASSTTLLRPLDHAGVLRVRAHLPAKGATVSVTWNGAVIDRVQSADFERAYTLPSRINAPNELRLAVDKWINPKRDGMSDDPRDLALQLKSISWE